jgi:endonuclease YncB( thermonuclease family)
MGSMALPALQLAPGTLSSAQYDRLLKALHRLLEKGRRREEEAVGRELVCTYHAVGSRLLAQKLAGKAGYGAAVVARLADDLTVDERTLHRAMAFARAYPDGSPAMALRWAHYRELLVLPDAEQRTWYAERALEQGWSAQKLREAVREQQYRNRAKAKPGKLGKRRSQLRRPMGERFFYKAVVQRVVDGDTIVVIVDLGFQVLKEQRLRLAAIDTPERGTPAGDRARDFVQRELASVDYVMLNTDKIDLYGRYVAHVFYAPGETDKRRIVEKGEYLNQRLVDEELAKAL